MERRRSEVPGYIAKYPSQIFSMILSNLEEREKKGYCNDLFVEKTVWLTRNRRAFVCSHHAMRFPAIVSENWVDPVLGLSMKNGGRIPRAQTHLERSQPDMQPLGNVGEGVFAHAPAILDMDPSDATKRLGLFPNRGRVKSAKGGPTPYVTIRGRVVDKVESKETTSIADSNDNMVYVINCGGLFVLRERESLWLLKEHGIRERREWAIGQMVEDAGLLGLGGSEIFRATGVPVDRPPNP